MRRANPGFIRTDGCGSRLLPAMTTPLSLFIGETDECS